MKYSKMRKLFLVPMYALSVFRSPLHRGKKQDTQIHRLGVNLRAEINETKTRSQRSLAVFKQFEGAGKAGKPRQRRRGAPKERKSRGRGEGEPERETTEFRRSFSPLCVLAFKLLKSPSYTGYAAEVY